MKIIKPILILILLQTLNLLADVKFDFTYADPPGTGFHAKPEAKAALEEVAATIGSHWLKYHNANLKIKITSSEEDNIKHSTDSFKVSLSKNSRNRFLYSSQEKIILPISAGNPSDIFDGEICISFAYPFSFSDQINENEFDFKALMIQKITQILGFGSLTVLNDQLMKNINEQFIRRLFIYGYNEIKGSKQEINLNSIINSLNFFNSHNIDIEEYIQKNASSPIGKIYSDLIIRFKSAIVNNTAFDVHANLMDELSNQLNKYELTIEDIIDFKYENLNDLTFEMLKLGMQKISDITTELSTENKIRKKFFAFFVLNENNYFSHFKDIIDSVSSETAIREYLKIIIDFVSEYFTDDSLSVDHEIALAEDFIDDVLDENGIKKSYAELLEQFEILLDTPPVNYSLFDKFLTYKNGQRLFNKGKTLKTLLSDFNEHIQETHLYFSGPYTKQYLNSPIKLEKKTLTFLANENSIMSPFYDKKGLKARTWDKRVTAVMLDLGYNVNNRWTQLWNIQDREKEFDLFQQNLNVAATEILVDIKKDIKKKLKKAKNKIKKKAKKIKKKLKDLL